MATFLGYKDFNKVRIKSDSYLPQYFADIEKEQNDLRRGAIEVFKGRQALKVAVTEEGFYSAAASDPYGYGALAFFFEPSVMSMQVLKRCLALRKTADCKYSPLKLDSSVR